MSPLARKEDQPSFAAVLDYLMNSPRIAETAKKKKLVPMRTKLDAGQDLTGDEATYLFSCHRYASGFYDHKVVQFERSQILPVLKHVNGNRTQAAKILGVKRTTLIEKIRYMGITNEHIEACSEPPPIFTAVEVPAGVEPVKPADPPGALRIVRALRKVGPLIESLEEFLEGLRQLETFKESLLEGMEAKAVSKELLDLIGSS